MTYTVSSGTLNPTQLNSLLIKSSSGDEIPERDVTYIVLYDYLFTTELPHTCTFSPEYFLK